MQFTPNGSYGLGVDDEINQTSAQPYEGALTGAASGAAAGAAGGPWGAVIGAGLGATSSLLGGIMQLKQQREAEARRRLERGEDKVTQAQQNQISVNQQGSQGTQNALQNLLAVFQKAYL